MGLLRKMAFGAAHHQPAQRQGAPVIDHTQHQGNATTPDQAAIHHDLKRLRRQCTQQLLGDGRKPAIDGVAVIFDEAAKSLNHTLLLCAIARCVVGTGGQMCVFAADQTADQCRQGVEMLFAMPLRARLVKLRDSLFYGTIPSIRVAHWWLLLTGNGRKQGEAYQEWRVSVFSTYFLYGSQFLNKRQACY